MRWLPYRVTVILRFHCTNIPYIPKAGGRLQEQVSLCLGTSRAQDRGRAPADETSEMASHQLCSP